MKICDKCGEEIKSRRKNICDKCYCKDYWIKNRPPPKVKQRYTHCVDCGKERKKHGRSVKYCDWCALKRSYAKDPSRLEKKNLQARNYHRARKGLPLDAPRMRAVNGSGYINKDGYRILCRLGHPNATNAKGSIGEHTLVMSEFLKRPLKKGETVHHINGCRSDNRLINLELWHKGHPPGQRVSEKIKWAIDFLKEYGFDIVNNGDNSIDGLKVLQEMVKESRIGNFKFEMQEDKGE